MKRARTGRHPDEHAEEEDPIPGTITRLQAQSGDPDRVSVYLDGRFAFGVYRDTVLAFGLRKGRMLDVDEQRRIRAADDVLRAKAKALHYLGQQARSEHEVRTRLRRSGFAEPAIDEAIGRLRELGLVDDTAYAMAYARSRGERSGYGPRRVRYDLMRRGVPAPLVERAVASVFEERTDVTAVAMEQARKRWSRLAGESDPMRRRKKLHDFLLRRGFDHETVRQVLHELEREGG